MTDPSITSWHRFAAASTFLPWAERWLPWLGIATAVLLVGGLTWGLVIAPADYQQGESYRIIFVHVPSAWMSMFVYVAMAVASAVYLTWNIKLADSFAAAAAPLGGWFTFLALTTGSLWGRPMWGAWWVWDARLTSELLLLFLYLGVIGLRASVDEPRRAARAAALLAVFGVINVPIIHYSVIWWNTLHQPPTITKFDQPSMHLSMLLPLLVCAIAFTCYFATAVLLRMRCDLLEKEKERRWLKRIYGDPSVSVETLK